jgi:hypothetical protein
MRNVQLSRMWRRLPPDYSRSSIPMQTPPETVSIIGTVPRKNDHRNGNGRLVKMLDAELSLFEMFLRLSYDL